MERIAIADSIFVSVVITTFNEGAHLDDLLSDVARQDLNGINVEVLILEAGAYRQERAAERLGQLSSQLKFINWPNASRTESLNHLFRLAKGDLIVRLDGRTRIERDYLQRITKLSSASGAMNVGGVMTPVGNTDDQRIVARLMAHPLAFGGGKSRDSAYKGHVDSVYLGAFNRRQLSRLPGELFDSVHPQISEDSEINFRIRKAGGIVFMDSSIKAGYSAREDLRKFFKLCFNYGVARGLFMLKHRQFSAYRQLAPPLAATFGVVFFLFGFRFQFLHQVLIWLAAAYFAVVISTAIRIGAGGPMAFCKVVLGFGGCHTYWTLGFFKSPFVYFYNLKRLRNARSQ